MSQMVSIQKKGNSALIQDFILEQKPIMIKSSANLASCSLCGRGLGDGCIVTAKNCFSQNLLFCEKHFPTKNFMK